MIQGDVIPSRFLGDSLLDAETRMKYARSDLWRLSTGQAVSRLELVLRTLDNEETDARTETGSGLF